MAAPRESPRFFLRTDKIIPRWFELLWYAGVIAIAGSAVVVFTAAADPAAIVFLVMGVLMAGFMRLMARGFATPERNFVLLDHREFSVTVYQPIFQQHPSIPYSLVERVEVGRHHSWWPLGYWPYTAQFGFHVDITLRERMLLPLGWGRVSPWVKVIHLDVADPEQLASELTHRVEASTQGTDRA